MNSSHTNIGPDHHLTVEEIAQVARNSRIKVGLTTTAKRKTLKARAVVEGALREKKVIYGITTGFGNFKNKTIDIKSVEDLQRNLIRSHSTGVGEPLTAEQVRAVMIVRLNSLSQGFSGVRLELIELIKEILNKNIVPYVPSQGSVGSSGDLAPLSHIGLVLMGEGRAWYGGKLMSGARALQSAGIKPLTFGAKEGLAFTNGTSVMTGIAALIVNDTKKLLNVADMGCALTAEAICAVSDAFDPRIHKVRSHIGQIESAKNIRDFIAGSKLIDSERDRIQDSYSLRCAPQVHGAVREAFSYVSSVVDREINAVTDNPLVFPDDGEVLSGGNFHGEPVAIAMDTLGIALSELANISERRIAKLIDPATNEGLPAFLIHPEKAGLHSGLMITQYTAAALVSENKVLAHPASVDSIPTSANQEDHVSMGTIAARKAVKILENVENVLAIEFLTACQGIDFRDQTKLGVCTKKAYKTVRRIVPFVSDDRELATDICNIRGLLYKIWLDFPSRAR